ncbi:adenosine-specific kinase [Nitrososphaera sp.]|uniref:adenosine-specific kinase n=1 Tax=Nitrososphaera sp. TaxID=1971748 RepID=UPI00307E8794
MELATVKIQPPEGAQLVLAQSHFIKTVEDVYECMVNCVPGIRFGLAFSEASGPCLVRCAGNDAELEKLAADYAYSIGAGHGLVILMKNAFPINVLPRLKEVPELVNVFCATANPVEVILAETAQGRAILGVVDGLRPKGIEDKRDAEERKQFLRNIGYKMS